jgi:hypothetical protein
LGALAEIAPLLRDLGAELAMVRLAGATLARHHAQGLGRSPPRSPLALLAAYAVVVAVEPVRVVSVHVDRAVHVPGTVA